MKRLGRILMVALLAAIPTLAAAQTASKDFPDNVGGCPAPGDVRNIPPGVVTSSMDVRLVVKGVLPGTLPHVKTQDLLPAGIPVSGCSFAAVVNKTSLDKVCAAAVAQGYTCSGVFGPTFLPCDCITGNATADCSDVGTGLKLDLACTLGGPTSGFSASRAVTPTPTATFATMQISPVSDASEIISMNHNTSAGNTVGTDMLPHFLVRVRPFSILGSVRFDVYHTGGGQNPRVGTVNITSANVNDPIAIHAAVREAINGLGLTLAAQVMYSPRDVSSSFRDHGAFVYVPDLQSKGIIRVSVTGQIGQEVESETGRIYGGGIPTLDPVGLALLALFLFLGGLWFLRRGGAPSRA